MLALCSDIVTSDSPQGPSGVAGRGPQLEQAPNCSNANANAPRSHSSKPWLTHAEVQHAIHAVRSEANAQGARRFFKVAEGEYAAHDRFLGVRVPDLRAISKRCSQLELAHVAKLLTSTWHEERLTALFIMVDRYRRCARRDQHVQNDLYAMFRQHLEHVNNWDLVDSSAWQLFGQYIRDHEDNQTAFAELRTLWQSTCLWQRRIAIVSTFAWIRQGDPQPTLVVAEKLLGDTEDLIHKAVGWMLREVGKRISRDVMLSFIEDHGRRMPRTSLRYAIEHLPNRDKRAWLTKLRAP